ncbi:probable 4-coumarate--CoA ligase 3 isoform X2 [Zootermopsis nevadensis]|uniref:Luciferin 4-monooxygenase n=2 Tax=Zootermopsis nevadensis TaxID=136037 RepID=A0A067R080_ZOONE|nr:probable 4-coumarate--CoA ligase 3 isoform X2 [Zootermopsis nevadensis]XP_021925929.1 probable 4-coumarate--CoA ligase 3 isoform X2 [Zootermopsis nevadensis]XP_021925930.1 probable 4-coumarate--CoA ligase 3 isoform X2 [Zootermopsis nevadensis]XP_021925931.1 probable 4-coumarate--CoA ligase 3 isoform X2 [Zootermopsis nevadensis]XP_021925932.1 probable 4-coumarate--CoA ligase 3 isoform X2 [Zootermopsis nevadensis]XP_021925933.1 probable 4-coumarate--CoA ligase 3 isoform X2 [Zootermopsis nevad
MNSWSTLQLGLRIVKNGRRTYRTMTSRRVGAVQKWTSFSNESARNLSTQEQNVVKSPYPDISVPDITLVDFVWDMVDKFPDSTALVCSLTGRKYTYAESRAIARRFAVSLRKAGFKHGDVIAVVLPNIPEYLHVLFGAIEAGMVVTTVNPGFTSDEILKQLRDSGATGIVTISEVYPNVSKAVSTLEAERKRRIPVIITPGLEDKTIPQGTINFQEMTHKGIDTSNLAADDRLSADNVVVLPYSSGTTGFPKGVKLSHRHLVTNCLQVLSEPKLNSPVRASHGCQEVLPALLPFYHIYGLLSLAIGSLYYGQKIITIPKFEPVHFLSSIAKNKATTLYLVPPLIHFIASHPDVKSSYFESVTLINNGAASVGLNDVERLLKKAPHVSFSQGYGLTESSPVACILEKGSTKYTSSGKPIPNTEMKIINMDTNMNLGPGEAGEVCIRGPQVMMGYHNNPQATAETIDSSGWLHTGDMGYYDEESNFYIVDRYKELIKVKGSQVAPAELEDILRSHPGIADAAVIGVSDQRSGEVPKAFIVTKQEELTEDDVKKFVAEKVSQHKHLKGGVEFIAAIPKNPTGKILRRKLKEMYSK